MVVTEPQGDIAAWLLQRLHYVPTPNLVVFGSFSEKENRLVGAVGFDNWGTKSVEMHCAGEGSRWVTKELLYKSFYYPFIIGGVNTIIGRVAADNKEALNFDKKLGFKEQCRIPNAWEDGIDLVILAMQKEDCRFLHFDKERYGVAA
jgi:L-amino acid N-acyltransferase YncA